MHNNAVFTSKQKSIYVGRIGLVQSR